MLVSEIEAMARSRGLYTHTVRDGASPYSGGAIIVGQAESVRAALNPSCGIRLQAEVRGTALTADPAQAYKGRVGTLRVCLVRADPSGPYVAGTGEEIELAGRQAIELASSNSEGTAALVPVEIRRQRLEAAEKAVFGGFGFGTVAGFDAFEALVTPE